MTEKAMSAGIQASSTRGLEASLSIAQHQSSQPAVEKHSKHHDELANVKLIPSILP
jgi:hypothetical protein